MALGFGVTKLTFTSDFRSYFGPDNPQLIAFENMEENFSKQDSLFFYIRSKNNDLFSHDGLSLISEFTEESWKLPHSQRVNSLQNYQHTKVEDDDLYIDYLYEFPKELSKDEMADIKNIVLNEPTLINNLISEDASATGVGIRLALPDGNTSEASKEAVAAARNLADKLRPLYPDFQILVGGSVTSNVTMGEAIEQDLQTLLLLAYLIKIIIMLALLRTFSGMLLTLLLITFSVTGTMGFFGWIGTVMTPPTGFVPTAIMTIAVADTIHILVSYYYELNQGKRKHDAIKESLRINFSPVFITSITTMIGVLCLNTSDSPPYRDMGNMIAVGVLLAWFYSITFLPAFLALIPAPKGKYQKERPVTFMTRFANFVVKRYLILLFVTGFTVIAVGSQVSRNEITERWHEFFDDSFEVRQTTKAVDKDLGGLHRLFFVMDSGVKNGINNPAYLQQINDFSAWLMTQHGVSHVDTLTDIIKRLNKNLHNDEEQWYRIPESADLAAQYLFLYELSLPVGLGLNDTISHDRSTIRLSAVLKGTDSAAILDLEARALSWLNENAPAIKTKESTGLDIVFANLTLRNVQAMLGGTAFAFVLISILMIMALRSVKIGLISLIPNIMPALLAYGLWGLLSGKVDTAVSVVVCLSLGIVVDDTVHFLSKYQRARQEKGFDAPEAIKYAFNTVGVALLVTSVILVGGFSVMQASHFHPSQQMGQLLAITIAVALLIDFLFLPPLLMLLDKRKYPKPTAIEPLKTAGVTQIEEKSIQTKTQPDATI
jgi:predicted RND superfamily exporter protein